MGTSFTEGISSDRLTSYPGNGESNLSTKRHRNRKMAPALWLDKTNFFFYLIDDIMDMNKWAEVNKS